MKKISRFTSPLVLLAGFAICGNAMAAQSLDVAKCHAPSHPLANAVLPLFGPHAATYQQFLVVCPVTDALGKPVLDIVALRQDIAADQHQLYFVDGKPWNEAMALKNFDVIPLPVIATEAGKQIGRLPVALFDDGPGVASVTLGDWRNGFPHRIAMRVDGAAVLGSYCPPPLSWNQISHRFLAMPGPLYTACH